VKIMPAIVPIFFIYIYIYIYIFYIFSYSETSSWRQPGWIFGIFSGFLNII
jgi:hypothetical protein